MSKQVVIGGKEMGGACHLNNKKQNCVFNIYNESSFWKLSKSAVNEFPLYHVHQVK